MKLTKHSSVLLFAFGIYMNFGCSFYLKGQIFTDQAEEWGVTGIVTSQEWGSGVSTYDFNEDGFDDISLVTDDGNLLFYKNVNGEYFVLSDFGIPSPTGFAKQVLWVDVDNDEDLDIFISTYFGKIKLYQNDGDFNFEDVTESAGLSTAVAANYGACFGDYNNDGNLDLHLTRYYLELPPPDNPNDSPNLWSRLYRNDGDGTFSDVTYQSNLYFNPVVAFQSVWFDLDNDNDQDNFIIVDRVPGNHLFIYDSGLFSDVTMEYGVSHPSNDFMSNTVGDYNNDGYLDIFMTNSGSVFGNTHSYLLKNENGNNLSDVSVSANLDIFDFGWGATWADVNNDGWKDIFYVTDEEFEHNNLFLNNGGFFTPAHNELNTDSDYPCYSVARGDFNNDGHYDLAVQGRDPNPSQLMMNSGSSNKWIKFKLAGTVSNSHAIGSTINAYVGGNQYMEYIFCGENYISQNSQHQIIGIGNAQIVDSLKVTYLSGHSDVYYNLAVNTTYSFTEGDTYSVQITASDTAVCSGETVTLNAGNHSEYLWNNGATSAQIVVDSAGIYSVQTTNEIGITGSDSIFISVNPLPEIVASTSLNPCNGDSLASIQLNNNSGVEADSVIWNDGLNGAFIDSLPAGEYSYQFTDLNGCMASGSIVLVDAPEMNIFAESFPSDPNKSNGSIFISIFGGVGPYTITLNGDTVESQVFNLAPGEYEVIVIDSYGCEQVLMSLVESTLATADSFENQFQIYPNPVTDELHIEPSLNIKRVELIDSAGKLVWNSKSFTNPVIRLKNIDSGIYLLKIETREGNFVSKRIIVAD